MSTIELSALIQSTNLLGYTGSQGTIGYTGSNGVGYTGSQGVQGSDGVIGYTGSAGTGGGPGGATSAMLVGYSLVFGG